MLDIFLLLIMTVFLLLLESTTKMKQLVSLPFLSLKVTFAGKSFALCHLPCNAGCVPASRCHALLQRFVHFGERGCSYPYPLSEPGGTVTQCAAAASKHQISLLWERPCLPTAVLLSCTNEAVLWAPKLTGKTVCLAVCDGEVGNWSGAQTSPRMPF